MHTMDKVMKGLHEFINERAPNGPQSEAELNQLIDEFMVQHNESIENLYGDAEPMDVYDYLDFADKAYRKKDKKEYLAKAAELEPDNADVKLAQAELEAKGPLELIEVLPGLIAEEEKRLKDQQIYNRSKGDFWLVVETRPYMRLLHRYLMNLTECGVINKAIQVGEEMMRLNRNDNLGIRFELMPLYAKVCNELKALKLYKQNKDEKTNSFYLLPLALLYFKLGDWPKAKSYLETLKQYYPIRKKLIRAIKKEDMNFIHANSSLLGYLPGTDEELMAAYLSNYSVYMTEPYFFEWADKALIVHRKPKK